MRSDLPAGAKNVATVLLTQFANHETGRCFPGNASLATATASSLATVKRLLRALEAGGWIVRDVAAGRGRKAAIRFTSPARLTRPEPRRAARSEAGKGVNPDPRAKAEKGSILIGKGVNPDPPYIRPEPTLTKRARGGARARPPADAAPARGPALSYRLIRFEERERIAEWDRWLAARGRGSLRAVAAPGSDAAGRGYLVPLRYPPEAGRADAERDVIRWLSWRLGCLEQGLA